MEPAQLPDGGQDLTRLATRLLELAADVIAVQEIHDAARLKQLMPGWELVLSAAGGRGGQKLGFLYDPSRPRARRRAARARAGSPRRRLGATWPWPRLRVRGGGPDFHVLVVHL